MPIDGNEFTLGLLDQTALSGWNSQALQAALVDDHADPPEDADTGTISPCPAPAPSPEEPISASSGNETWRAAGRLDHGTISPRSCCRRRWSRRAVIPSPEEQAQSLRFTGFGAIELAQNCFCRPGEGSLRPGWEEIGTALEAAVAPAEYAANRSWSWSPAWAPPVVLPL